MKSPDRQERSGGALNRMPQLDGLRAFAVLAVFIEHYHIPWLRSLWVDDTSGSLGVQLFFVLSGFLITGILLRGRDFSRETDQTVAFTLRRFYIRRFLRIFPLYYFMIFTLAVVGLFGVVPLYHGYTQIIQWHALYLTNVYVVVHNAFPPQAGHLWTLAIEEQFYVLWPWLILLTPRPLLKYALMFTVFLAVVYRVIAIELGWSTLAIARLTPTCLNTLAGGALLAYLLHRGRSVSMLTRQWLPRLAIIGLPCMVAGYALGWPDHTGLPAALLQWFGTPLVFAWLVMRAADGFQGPVGRVLQSPPALYVGKISYGLYVIHFLVPGAWIWFSAHIMQMPGFLQYGTVGGFILFTITSLIAATLSWQFLERPFNQLKRRFPYRQQPTPQLAAQLAGGAA